MAQKCGYIEGMSTYHRVVEFYWKCAMFLGSLSADQKVRIRSNQTVILHHYIQTAANM